MNREARLPGPVQLGCDLVEAAPPWAAVSEWGWAPGQVGTAGRWEVGRSCLVWWNYG